MTKQTTEQDSIEEIRYQTLRKEISNERLVVHASVDYYNALAAKFAFRSRFAKASALISAGVAAATVWPAMGLVGKIVSSACAALATTASAINLVGNWSERQVNVLNARNNYKDLECAWEDLWLKVEQRKIDNDAVMEQISKLRQIDADITKQVEPHDQDDRKVAAYISRAAVGLGYKENQNENQDHSR